ncbi:hypothetical protein D6777_01460 [Candidatus Woesearchaeota archaeon]|nr:MAG: hypothetical protein D6777_01460 [Candidatus Woesearchaeota archaeon]
MTKNILIFCAHSDDEAVGMAGTISKLVENGYDVYKVVFSYGESSHPHFREEVVINKRTKETKKASEFLGIKETIFLGMKDTKVKEDIEETNAGKIVEKILSQYKPKKIYIPTEKDPHPDHRAVNNFVLNLIDKLKLKVPVYEYEVWNIVNENKPMVYEDITKYYKKKIQYMKMFSSQWQYMYALWLPVYFRSRKYGNKNNCKFAERFYKVR